MTARHIAGDGQAQAYPLAVGIAAFVEAVEGFEGVFVLVGRDAGAVIIDQDLDAARVGAADRDGDIFAVFAGVVDQIGQ